MLGEKAFEILKELQRSPETIPNFNDEGLRQVLEENKVIFEQNCSQAAAFSNSGDRLLWPLLNFRHAALQRNKRCLLAYLNERLHRIKLLRWGYGSVIPQDLKSFLCEPEIEFFNEYSKLLANYMKSISCVQEIDLTEDTKPPKTLYIEVRCVEDYGKFELQNGTVIFLSKNTQHYLPRQQIESLIRQGILKHII